MSANQISEIEIQEAKDILGCIEQNFKNQEDVAEFLGSNRQIIWGLQTKNFCTYATYRKIKDAKIRIESDAFQKIKARHKRKLRAYDVIGVM